MSDCGKFMKMGARVSLFKLLLFQMFVAWCGSKHVAYAAPSGSGGGGAPVNFVPNDVAGDIQNQFRHFLHSGKYSSQHLDHEQAEVVVPIKVSREGALVSHAVEHKHDEHARTRRSAGEREREHSHTLHYNITVGGRDLRLDLRPSPSFVTPSLVVERHTADGGRTRSRPHVDAARCHYRGSVRGQPASSIALSACDGLAGLLRTEHGEYWIEPSNRVPTEQDTRQGRAHLVYKRSAVSNHARSPRAIDPNQPNRYNHQQPYDRRRVHTKEYYDKRRRNQLEQTHERNRNNAQQIRQMEQRRNLAQQRNSLGHNEQVRRLVVNGTYALKEEDLKLIDRAKERREWRGKAVYNKRGRRKHRRRRRRRKKNCATREPPRSTVQWTQRNEQYNIRPGDLQRRNRTHPRHRPHPHLLSHRAGFPPAAERAPPPRRARSVSREHHVEVLLVADDTMIDFHKDDIETYLLTIMNMVSSLYLDHTIGNFINVVVVKIILIESPPADQSLHVSSDSDATLASFCRWQQHQNPNDDSHRHHHDVAIFITRQNLCGKNDASCSTLGVAHVAGMCQPERSCSVNEDNGLSLAHTITHELGHNFGLYHDTEKIGCLRRVGSTLHIMTPIFEADTVEVAWSRCSRRDVTNFLDAGMAECLGDEPSNSSELFDYPQVPAGAMFDAESQCRLVWGADVHEVCNEVGQSICEHLWCNVNNSCKTNLRGAAPGTPCGPDMWCQNQKCLPRREQPPPQDGGWGEWSEWSGCSRTCGAGVSTQRRHCDNPVPLHTGKFCTGERTRYKICNTDPCPKNKPSFRQVQCLKYGNDTAPSVDHDEPCELYCSTPNQTFAGPFGDYAADGTPCNVGTNDMCISGICRRVGCDWVVDSNATVDSCGVCNGDGIGCEMVHGIYSKDTTKESGYSEVAVIPAGSRNVKIEEIANSKNYIGIGSAKSRKFYLNGRRKVNLAGEYLVAGSPAVYERDHDWEKVRIPGPIKEDIKIYQMLYRGKHRNPGVTYQYTIDRKPAKEARHWWKVSGWTACSRSCGGGITRQLIDCIDDRNHVVDPEYCIMEPELQRPPELAEHCNVAACPATTTTPAPASRAAYAAHTTQSSSSPATHWWVGSWSGCSHLCYHWGGQRPVRRRGVYCVEKLNNRVKPESDCDAKTKPITQIHCVGVPACAAKY